MIKIRDFWKKFWDVESYYYGVLKGIALYLAFTACKVFFVVGIYWWTDKL
jgi:hypothetical protein